MLPGLKTSVIAVGVTTLILVSFTVGFRALYSPKDLKDYIITSDSAGKFSCVDIDNDGISEIFLFEFDPEAEGCFKLTDLDLRPKVDRHLANTLGSHRYFVDQDQDGNLELCISRMERDSVVFSFFDCAEVDCENSLEISLPTGRDINGDGFWDGMIQVIGTIDADDDGFEELLFQMHANRDFQPRALLAYDQKEGRTLWRYDFGTAISWMQIEDYNGDNKDEVLTGSHAFGNGDSVLVNGTSDSYSYAIMISNRGKLIWQRQLGGLYSWCSVEGTRWTSRDAANILCVVWPTDTIHLGVDDNADYSRGRMLALSGENGSVTRQVNLGIDLSSYQYTLSCFGQCNTGLGLVTTGKDGRLRIVDSDLSLIRESRRYISPDLLGFSDIDADGIDEVFVRTTRSRMAVLNKYLQEIAFYDSQKHDSWIFAEFAAHADKHRSRLVFGSDYTIVSRIPPVPPVVMAGVYWWLGKYHVLPIVIALASLLAGYYAWQRVLWVFLAIRSIEASVSPDHGIIGVDRTHRLLFANRTAQRMIAVENWRSRSIRELLPEEQARNLMQFIVDAETGGRYVDHMVIPLETAGRVRHLRFKILGNGPSRSKALRFLSITDEHDRSPKQIYVKWYELHSHIAHKLKTVIASALHSVQLLPETVADPQRSTAGKADVDFHDLKEALGEARDLAKKLIFVPPPKSTALEKHKLSVLLQQAADSEVLRSGKPVSVNVTVEGDFVVETDDRALRDVVSLLIQNSLEAVDGDDADIQIIANAARDLPADKVVWEYTIEIRDNGCGISSENLSRVFDLHFTTKSDTDGTGLGLARALQICTQLGGKLYVKESELAKGTTIALTFGANEGIM